MEIEEKGTKAKKVNNMVLFLLLIIIPSVMFFILLIFLDGSKSNDILIASIGLITFMSIFYGFMINSKIYFDSTRTRMYEEFNEKIEKSLAGVSSSPDKLKKLKELTDLIPESNRITILGPMFNLNLVLLISVLAYLGTIVLHFIPDPFIIKKFLFSIGIVTSYILIIVWFVSYEMNKEYL